MSSVTTEQPKVRLRLDEDVRAEVARTIIEYVTRAVSDASDRDDMLREFNDLVEGIADDGEDAPWRGACTLVSPIIFEAHLTLRAMLSQALKRDPKVVVEAQQPEDEEAAQAQEAWIVNKSYACELDKHLDAIISQCLKYPVCPVYTGWIEDVREERTMRYREKGKPDGPLLSDEDTEEGVEYEEQPYLVPEVIYRGVEIRPVDLLDFYMYPADARSPDRRHAFLTAERLVLTSDQLIAGIDEFGYDRERVYELLEAGPTEFSEEQAERVEDTSWLNGLRASDTGDSDTGFFECFLVFTRMPDCEGVPDYTLTHDMMAVVCPQKNVVLKLDYSPHQHKRPYTSVYMAPRPDNWYGWCLPQMLYTHQKEATANIRFGVNCFNFQTAPVIKAKKGRGRDVINYKVYPGAVLEWETNPDEILPFPMPQTAGEALAFQQYIKEDARSLYSSGGYGQLANKVRKAGEIQNVQVAAASKFELFLSCVQTGLVDLILRIVTLNMEHMDEGGETFLDEFGQKRTITPQQLRGKFIYRATGNAQNANLETRAQIAEGISTITESYAALELKGVPPHILKRMWHAKRNQLIDMGVHDPDSYLGKEPQEPPPQANSQVVDNAMQLQGPMGAAQPGTMPQLPPGQEQGSGFAQSSI